MKKLLSILLCMIMMFTSLLMLTASAWETPKLMLAADYDERSGMITVEYRLLDFAGTESADFRLRYDTDVLELKDYRTVKMNDVIMEVLDNNGIIAIQFVDLYHVKEEDCEEDGSATVATLTFKVKDKSADNVVFISTADSCNMDPDSAEVMLDRATLKLSLADGSTSAATVGDYSIAPENLAQTKSNIKKVIAAAVAAAVIFLVLLVLIVVKYRKKKD